MNKILLFLFLFLSVIAKSQKIRFTDTTNKWSILYSHSWFDSNGPQTAYDLYRLRYDSVVIYNGLEYNVLRDNYSDSALVREDTVSGKIYVVPFHYCCFPVDTVEFVLFDYNLNVGDTFTTRGFSRVVHSIDSTLINGVWHRVYDLHGIAGASWFYFIEGIGSTSAFLMTGFEFMFEYDQNLICFENNGISPVIAPDVQFFDNSTSCNDSMLTVVEKQVATTVVYPNPASDYIKIRMSEAPKLGTLNVYNSYGQVVQSKEVRNSNEVIITNDGGALKGIYYYRIRDEKGIILHRGSFSFL